MSNYRDDTQETAIASSDTWLGLSTLTESVGRIAATVFFGLGVMHSDQASASDEVVDRANHVVVEAAIVSDEFTDALTGGALVIEKARIAETFKVSHGVLHKELATITDQFTDRIGGLLVDSAALYDEVIGQRTAHSLVVEQAQISDQSSQVIRDLAADSALAGESIEDSLSARSVIDEVALASDTALDAHRSGISPVSDLATVAAEVVDALRARDLVEDLAIAEDLMPGNQAAAGLAWTAGVDNWAMSRYVPYGFSHIAVIDGVAYGETEDGVYALSGGAEQIEGRVLTGKLDMARGGLAHPVAAYLEYSLAGSIEMDVTTTQAGTPSTYTYKLPPETADELTNGRFQFGRGLRGRHFTFALRVTGEHSRINDLSVQTAQTKRRV